MCRSTTRGKPELYELHISDSSSYQHVCVLWLFPRKRKPALLQFTQGALGTNTMNLQVPLGSYPGRGVSLPINLNYSSKVWRLGFIRSIYYTYGGSNSVAEAIYSEYATAGWTTSLDVPILEWPKQSD